MKKSGTKSKARIKKYREELRKLKKRYKVLLYRKRLLKLAKTYYKLAERSKGTKRDYYLRLANYYYNKYLQVTRKVTRKVKPRKPDLLLPLACFGVMAFL